MSSDQHGPTEPQKIRAMIWMASHTKHIEKITTGIGSAYPPTDSETCNNPALWKPEHWAWFLEKGN